MRITERDLRSVVDRINRMTGSPMLPYLRQDSRYIAQVVHYHLDGAYGGWQLCRMASESGGVNNVLNCGFVSKKELYDLMQAFIKGIETEAKK